MVNSIGEVELTERQQRELSYYEEYCATHNEAPPNFAPVEGKERRPWNPYWHAYELAVDHFRDSSQRLLDFGCGTGQTAMLMARLGYRVNGFDISPSQITACAQRSMDLGLDERTEFDVQVSESLTYEDERFDCIIGIDILHHIEIGPSIEEAYRVLKPGGIAIFKEWVEVPLFDTVRESELVRRFFPKDMSLEKHLTHDERKLNSEDLRIIRHIFPHVEERRFCLTSRIRRVMPKRGKSACGFERLDWNLVRMVPVLGKLGGETVLVLRK